MKIFAVCSRMGNFKVKKDFLIYNFKVIFDFELHSLKDFHYLNDLLQQYFL